MKPNALQRLFGAAQYVTGLITCGYVLLALTGSTEAAEMAWIIGVITIFLHFLSKD